MQKKILLLIIFFFVAIIGLYYSTIIGTVTIDKNVPSFNDEMIRIQLWEYNPYLADASADLSSKKIIRHVSHIEGKKESFSFFIRPKLFPKPWKKYYITSGVYSKNSTSYQDYNPDYIYLQCAHNEFCKVFPPVRISILTQ